jgi:hypothetical protein
MNTLELLCCPSPLYTPLQVVDLSYNRNPMYHDSWVADVSVISGSGEQIRRYLHIAVRGVAIGRRLAIPPLATRPAPAPLAHSLYPKQPRAPAHAH